MTRRGSIKGSIVERKPKPPYKCGARGRTSGRRRVLINLRIVTQQVECRSTYYCFPAMGRAIIYLLTCGA